MMRNSIELDFNLSEETLKSNVERLAYAKVKKTTKEIDINN